MTKPILICTSGRQAYELRRHLFLNQTEFWAKIDISQSGGSRYEKGRDMPEQVQYLLHMAYGTNEQATELLEWLRNR